MDRRQGSQDGEYSMHSLRGVHTGIRHTIANVSRPFSSAAYKLQHMQLTGSLLVCGDSDAV